MPVVVQAWPPELVKTPAGLHQVAYPADAKAGPIHEPDTPVTE